MNWRTAYYIALAFLTRRVVQFMLLAVCGFGAAIGMGSLGSGGGIARPQVHYRLKWEHAYAYLPTHQRLDLDRAGLVDPAGTRGDGRITYLSVMNARRSAERREITFLTEPLGRAEMERIVARFPRLTSLKVWGEVSEEGWAALKGADHLKDLELQETSGKKYGTLSTLPHLPALERVVVRIGGSATVLAGLGQNNPQVRELMINDIYVAQRGQNLPFLPLEGLNELRTVAVYPSAEPAPGEQVFAKWDPKHPVLSKGYRYSQPSDELIAALKQLPKLERVLCCDYSAGDWGLAELREALGGRVQVEPAIVVRVRSDQAFLPVMGVAPAMFFVTFLLVFQSGATFAHELSQTVPNYARAHVIVFGGAFATAVLLFACGLKLALGAWWPSLAYALFLASSTAVAIGGTQMQLRPKWLISRLQWVLLPLFILFPLLPALTQLYSDNESGQAAWWQEQANRLFTAITLPTPQFVVMVMLLGVALAAWFFGGLPRLAGRLQAENARGAFIHPFDQNAAAASWPAATQGLQTPQALSLGIYPSLESPVTTDRPIDHAAAVERLGNASGPSGVLSHPAAFLMQGLYFIPVLAVYYHREFLSGDFVGAVLVPLPRWAMIGVLGLMGLRLAIAATRRPYCPYEAILPLTRDGYHSGLQTLFWKTLVVPSFWAFPWAAAGAAVTLWREGGEDAANVICCYALLGFMVTVLSFAASEFARWALTIRSDMTVMIVGILLGMPLMQASFLTLLMGRFTGNIPTATVVGLLTACLGGGLVGMVFYVINAHRYRKIEWGRLSA